MSSVYNHVPSGLLQNRYNVNERGLQISRSSGCRYVATLIIIVLG